MTLLLLTISYFCFEIQLRQGLPRTFCEILPLSPTTLVCVHVQKCACMSVCVLLHCMHTHMNNILFPVPPRQWLAVAFLSWIYHYLILLPDRLWGIWGFVCFTHSRFLKKYFLNILVNNRLTKELKIGLMLIDFGKKIKKIKKTWHSDSAFRRRKRCSKFPEPYVFKCKGFVLRPQNEGNV